MGHPRVESVPAVHVDRNGLVYLAGTFIPPDAPFSDEFNIAYLTRIDPVQRRVDYTTILDGASFNGMTVDALGRPIVVGDTVSQEFPVSPDAPQPQLAGEADGFIVRLAANGTSIQSATLAGGSGADSLSSVALLSNGDVCAAGSTRSPNLPVVRALQPTAPDLGPASRFLDNGWLACWSPGESDWRVVTYLGEASRSPITDMVESPRGGVALCGSQLAPDGYLGAWVAELFPDLSAFRFQTRLGGGFGNSLAHGIAAASAGEICVAGETSDPAFPVTIGVPVADRIRFADRGFVTKLDASGRAIRFARTFGNRGELSGGFSDIAIHPNTGSVWAVGGFLRDFFSPKGRSSDLPLVGFWTRIGEAYLVCVDRNGRSTLFSTHLPFDPLSRTSIQLGLDGRGYLVGAGQSLLFRGLSGLDDTVQGVQLVGFSTSESVGHGTLEVFPRRKLRIRAASLGTGKGQVFVVNHGSDPIDVQANVVFGPFSVDPLNSSFTLGPGKGRTLLVTLSGGEDGSPGGLLTLCSNARSESIKRVWLDGIVGTGEFSKPPSRPLTSNGIVPITLKGGHR